MKKRGDPNFYTKQEILKKFLKQYPTTKTKLAAELKFLKMLTANCSLEFLLREFALGFKVDTMLWFFSKDGKLAIESGKKKSVVDFSEKKEYSLQESKVGEDIKIDKKPKNLKDFLCQK